MYSDQCTIPVIRMISKQNNRKLMKLLNNFTVDIDRLYPMLMIPANQAPDITIDSNPMFNGDHIHYNMYGHQLNDVIDTTNVTPIIMRTVDTATNHILSNDVLVYVLNRLKHIYVTIHNDSDENDSDEKDSDDERKDVDIHSFESFVYMILLDQGEHVDTQPIFNRKGPISNVEVFYCRIIPIVCMLLGKSIILNEYIK